MSKLIKVIVLIIVAALVFAGAIIIFDNIHNKEEETLKISDENLVFINSIEEHGEDYLLKCSLYEYLTIPDSALVNGKIMLDNEEYEVVNEGNGYELKLPEYEVPHYSLIYNANTDRYIVRSSTEFAEVWRLSDKKIEIIADKKANIIEYDTLEKISITDYYLENKGIVKEAKQTTNPGRGYGAFLFENGKCIELTEIITGH